MVVRIISVVALFILRMDKNLTNRMNSPLRPLLAAGLAFALGIGASAAELTVSAAASLTNAFQELGPQFEVANPGTKVLFNFGASGALLQQIAKGAPVDVFASADQETMDQAHAPTWYRLLRAATSCRMRS